MRAFVTNAHQPPLAPLFYTGVSRFLEANEHFVRAMVAASAHCPIHASEDIVDANGMKLWARGQPIADRLLERLSNRRLRKPIELCVYASDPIAAAGIAQAIESRVCASADLQAALDSDLGRVLKIAGSISPNPTELMLFSVMRHTGHDMMEHAALVGAVALAMAAKVDVHPDVMRSLLRAALFHDVGELYLVPTLFDSRNWRSADEVRQIRTHPAIGAQVSVELAHSGSTVGHLIALSHERLDGWGYPRGLKAAELPLAAQALLFAEAMAPMLESEANGLRRAAVAAHLVPGEFAPEMVNWVVRCGQGCHVVAQPDLSAEAIGLELQHVHSLLARVLDLLRAPALRETAAVRSAAAQWLSAIEGLMRELRTTGIDGALCCGYSVEPQNPAEMVELSVLAKELLYRIRTLGLRVALAQADTPELGASSLVVELLEALRACEPLPAVADGLKEAGEAIFPWSNLFSIGVREIDEQHRILVGLLNRLGGAAQDYERPALIGEILGGLVAYIGEHFSFEEHLMREHGYPGAEAHIAAHTRLAARVEKLVASHAQGTTPELDELVIFLRQWLVSHILQTDKELAKALNAKGVH